MNTANENMSIEYMEVYEGREILTKFVVNDENYIDIYMNDRYMDTMYDLGVVTTRSQLRKITTELYRCWGTENVKLFQPRAV